MNNATLFAALLSLGLAQSRVMAKDIDLGNGSTFSETIKIWPLTGAASNSDVAKTVGTLLSEKFTATHGGKGLLLVVVTASQQISNFGVSATAVVGLSPALTDETQRPTLPRMTFRGAVAGRGMTGEGSLVTGEVAAIQTALKELMAYCEKDPACNVMGQPTGRAE